MLLYCQVWRNSVDGAEMSHAGHDGGFGLVDTGRVHEQCCMIERAYLPVESVVSRKTSPMGCGCQQTSNRLGFDSHKRRSRRVSSRGCQTMCRLDESSVAYMFRHRVPCLIRNHKTQSILLSDSIL